MTSGTPPDWRNQQQQPWPPQPNSQYYNQIPPQNTNPGQIRAIGLSFITLSIISFLSSSFMLYGLFLAPSKHVGVYITTIVIFALNVFCSILILIAGIYATMLKGYKMVMTGAIISLIPCLSPCYGILGLPFGIWAVVALSKPEYKDLFNNTGTKPLSYSPYNIMQQANSEYTPAAAPPPVNNPPPPPSSPLQEIARLSESIIIPEVKSAVSATVQKIASLQSLTLAYPSQRDRIEPFITDCQSSLLTAIKQFVSMGTDSAGDDAVTMSFKAYLSNLASTLNEAASDITGGNK